MRTTAGIDLITNNGGLRLVAKNYTPNSDDQNGDIKIWQAAIGCEDDNPKDDGFYDDNLKDDNIQHAADVESYLTPEDRRAQLERWQEDSVRRKKFDTEYISAFHTVDGRSAHR